MEYVKQFLDTSTIHGMSWISRSRKYAKLFWISIVFGGFTGSLFLIQESFSNWNNHPITTTVETLPINEINFPNVTVCPPKNLYLNLNYDFMKAGDVKLNKNTRTELLDYALDVTQNEFYKEFMRNLSKLEDPDRYHNWYHGFTLIKTPFYGDGIDQLFYQVETTATSGNISTQYFGDKFNAENVEGKIHISVQVFIPQSVLFTINETLTLHVEKISMAEDSDKEVMKLNCYSDDCYIDPDVTETSKNITDPFPSTFEFFSHNRQVSQEEINDAKI